MTDLYLELGCNLVLLKLWSLKSRTLKIFSSDSSYFPHFWTFVCKGFNGDSLDTFNGLYREGLSEILKDQKEWLYSVNGFRISDWGSTEDRHESYRYSKVMKRVNQLKLKSFIFWLNQNLPLREVIKALP